MKFVLVGLIFRWQSLHTYLGLLTTFAKSEVKV